MPHNLKDYFLIIILLVGTRHTQVNAELLNPDPTRFSNAFEQFKVSDKSFALPVGKLTLFTGSSSIRRWKSLASDFPEITLVNRGFGGSHISDVIYYYNNLFPRYRPKQIIFYCGENDLWSGKSVDQVFKDFQTLWYKINMDLPNTKLIYLSCKPSPKRFKKWNIYQSLNLRIKNLCLRNQKLFFVDLTPTLLNPNFTFNKKFWDEDQLHVNQLGYGLWKKWLHPVLHLSR